MPVPGRDNFVLSEQLGASHGNETWRARQSRSGDTRVYKFAVDGERLAALKREATVYRLLHDSLGERADLARVLDWQFEQPPFFLECEDGGRSLSQWAADGALAAMAPAERLALVLQLLDAVAAAHGVGVLHKDLKPGNVLVAPAEPARPEGRHWQLRLVDFGSASLLEPERLAQLQITALGLTVSAESDPIGLAGTAYYLAPELHTGTPFSVRSDQYALGVLAYQLLAGDLQRIPATGWQRDLGDALLATDLARATDMDPARRFGSVADLAEHLRRLPERRQQQARQEQASGQAAQAAAQLARARARQPWVLASLVLLLAGLLVALWLWDGQRRARAQLEGQLSLVRALHGVLADDLIAAANPGLAGRATVSVAEALSAAASGVPQRLAGEAPGVRAGLHLALQRAFSSLSRFPEAIEQGRQALAVLADSGDVDSRLRAEAQLQLAADLVQMGHHAEARGLLAGLGEGGWIDRLGPAARARWLWARAWAGSGVLALRESLALLQQADAALAQLPAAEAADPGNDLLRDRIAFDQGQTWTMLGDLAAGERRLRSLLAQQQARFGVEHARPLYTQVALAANLGYQLQADEAKRLLLQAGAGLARLLGPDDRKTLMAYNQLATVHFRAGEFAQAAAQWAPVALGYRRLTGPISADTLTVDSNRGLAWLYAGDAARAEPVLRDALDRARQADPGPRPGPRVQQIRFALADGLLDLGHSDEAATLLEGLSAEQINLAQQAADWPARLDWLRARRLADQGRLDEARTLLDALPRHLDPDGQSRRYNALAVAQLRRLLDRKPPH